MSIDSIIQIVSIMLAAVTFVVALRIEKRKDRKATNRELYQNLEFASIDLFRFEAENLNLIKPIWESGAEMPENGTAKFTATMNYVCQMLNLFEMAIKFREDKTLPADVFGSWIAWFHLLLSAPGFPVIWEEVEDDYLPELQDIFNGGLKIINETEDEEANRQKFYQFVGYILKCKIIEEWTDKSDDDIYEQFNRIHFPVKEKNKLKDESRIEIRWLNRNDNPEILKTIFLENKGGSYISHSEIQEGRAVDQETWSDDLGERLLNEFTEALQNKPFCDSNLAGILIDSEIAGFAFVEFDKQSESPFATLSDIVVKEKWQDFDAGTRIVSWLKKELMANGIKTMYAESNINNDKAHHFLKKQAFNEISKVFYMEL